MKIMWDYPGNLRGLSITTSVKIVNLSTKTILPGPNSIEITIIKNRNLFKK